MLYVPRVRLIARSRWSGLMVHMWRVHLGTLTMLGLNFFGRKLLDGESWARTTQS